jgi:hypothetical protein
VLFLECEVRAIASYGEEKLEKERENLDRDLMCLCLETYGLLMANAVDQSYLSHAFPCTKDSMPAVCPC